MITTLVSDVSWETGQIVVFLPVVPEVDCSEVHCSHGC